MSIVTRGFGKKAGLIITRGYGGVVPTPYSFPKCIARREEVIRIVRRKSDCKS